MKTFQSGTVLFEIFNFEISIFKKKMFINLENDWSLNKLVDNFAK